ncbi:MAG: SpoIIE family protein phosphatase [Anaerobiospirillum sp.]|nr:SpoIIE family protein phosphatase [Anaerobiospirillum sp.]
MKLQACSKIITLTALGFTLTAAGAFYALNQAQQNLMASYQQNLEQHLDSVGADLQHYVQRINGDYYQLINQSLSNILSLDQSYYQKDPLLAFFDHNIRTHSAYSSGENLRLALDSLAYFKIPYISHDFKSGKTEVHGLDDSDRASNLLEAIAQDGTKVSEQISKRPALEHGFSIFFSGSDFLIGLKIYDRAEDRNYYVLTSYLNVLNNTVANIKYVFADIDPMIAGILEGDAVKIVRHGTTIFATKEFTLELDAGTDNLRKLVGVHLIDEQGQLIADPTTVKPTDNAAVVATSYLRSINSYLMVQRPFDLYAPDFKYLHWAQGLIIALSALFFALILRRLLKEGNVTKHHQEDVDHLIKKIDGITTNSFKLSLTHALAQLRTKPQDSPQEATQSADKNAAPEAAQDGAQAAVPAEAESTAESKDTTNAAETNKAPAPSTEQAPESASAQDADHAKKPAASARPEVSEQSASANSAAAKDEHGEEAATLDDSEERIELSAAERDAIDQQLLKELLAGEAFDEHSAVGRIMSSSLKVARELTQDYHNEICTLKDEFKGRIGVYRKEGQFMAARQMLLSALPQEDAMPSSNFVDFAAFSVPARELSGNFYTIKRLDEDNLAFVMGDCATTGIKAAYTVAVVNVLVEEALKLDLDPPHVMAYLNERLCEIPNISTVALFIGMISEKTGNIIAANAGHAVPLYVDDQGAHFIAEPNEQRLGLSKDQEFDLLKCFMANDDMLVLYSNGIIQVKNAQGEDFGMERLMGHCDTARAQRADELVIKILNDLKQHKGKRPFRQDVSLICLKQQRISF